MNWKSAPHLFANGEFKADIPTFGGQYLTKSEVLPIIGIEFQCFNFEFGTVPISDCTLIARPISDMTDEEIHKVTEHMIRPHSMSFDMEKLLNNKDDFRLALNLISIGVLPKLFEEGFKTGTVINVNEL